jgi:hypothetical protein
MEIASIASRNADRASLERDREATATADRLPLEFGGIFGEASLSRSLDQVLMQVDGGGGLGNGTAARDTVTRPDVEIYGEAVLPTAAEDKDEQQAFGGAVLESSPLLQNGLEADAKAMLPHAAV